MATAEEVHAPVDELTCNCSAGQHLFSAKEARRSDRGESYVAICHICKDARWVIPRPHDQ